MNSKGEYQPRVGKVAAELVAIRLDPNADTAAIQIVTTRLHQAERDAIAHAIDLVESVPQDRTNFVPLREALVYLRAVAKAEEAEQ